MTCNVIKTLITFPAEGEWHKELNLISWNGRWPKYDLRSWNNDGKYTKGTTLTREEAEFLQEQIAELNFKEGVAYV